MDFWNRRTFVEQDQWMNYAESRIQADIETTTDTAVVIDDAGMLIDTWEIDEWVTAVNRMWQADDREEWSVRGVAHAAKFSWKKAAQDTLDVYRQVGQE